MIKRHMIEFEMLEELLSQDQFELLLPDRVKNTTENKAEHTEADTEVSDIRLVYLMNDAVESFLVFKDARMTGHYKPDYEGELQAALSKQPVPSKEVSSAEAPSEEAGSYILVVHQGDTVVTLFFKDLTLETHLYNYGKIAHFWVEDYEYLRQLEYRIAILKDKYEYLGSQYCNAMEEKLASLAYFPPLNYCCYPAVSQQYIVPHEDSWTPSEEAIDLMIEFAGCVRDHSMERILKRYRRYPVRILARRIATMLHRNRHAALVDYLTDRITEAAASYPDRMAAVANVSATESQSEYDMLLTCAAQRQEELRRQGIRTDLLREEPFVVAPDSVGFKVFLMKWKKGFLNRKVEIEEFSTLQSK